MKKFLSLVLALVMTMSLVTVSAGAKDFTDNSKINYKEAVDVMSAAKVIDGYAEGDFRPANTLTRGAAAKIICNLILGPTTAEALVADAAPYKDVPTTNVFAGYIAYCAKEGIISGYADGTFRPAATLSGYAFMKMLLGALGYDATTEGYIGNNWSINVAKRALNVGLDDDLKGEFNGTKAVNREEACLYAFNTLKAPMVEYANSSSVTINGITFTNKSDAKEIENKDASGKTVIIEDDLLNFCEKYFTKLDKKTASDDFGRPAHEWKYDKKSVGTYADSAVLTYTDEVKANVMADDAKDAGYDLPETVIGVAADKQPTIALYVNGYNTKNITIKEMQDEIDAKTAEGGKGIAIELYANDDDVINRIVVIKTYIAKVDSIGKDKTSTKAVDERSLTLSPVQLKDTSVARYEDDTIGFDDVYSKVAKGDYVLYVPYGDTKTDKVVSIMIPETVEGALTYTSTSAVKVGGEKYSLAKVEKDRLNGKTYDLSSKTVNLYLDQYGYAIYSDAADSTSDKAVAVLKVYQTLNSDGELVDMIKGVTSDGETVTWEYQTGKDIEDVDGNKVEGSVPAKNKLYTYVDIKDSDAKALLGGVGTGEAADGAFVAVDTTKDLKTSTKTLTVGSDKVKAYYDDDVKFIFVDDGKATVKNGAQKVVAGTAAYATLKEDDGVFYVTAVFVKAAASASSTTSDEIVYVGKADGTIQIKVNGKDKTYNVYKAYIDGNKLDEFYTEGNASGFYSIEVDDDSKAYITKGNQYTATSGELTVGSGNVAAINGNILTIGDEDYTLSGAIISDITGNDNDIDSASLLKDAVKAAGKNPVKVSFLYDSDDNSISCLYVTSYTEWEA